jgi:hypothetical protein
MKDIRWHMIGHLQTNKINRVLPVVHAIQTLDRAKLIEGVGQKLTRPLRAWIEVNIDSESDKSGAQLSEVPALLELSKKFKNLDVIGLMAIPNPQNQDQDQLNSLARLKTQARSCGLTQISWGMSQDFESAIHNGSTCVRIGTSLFGERKSGGNA